MKRFDIVVIGAGIAGLAVALRRPPSMTVGLVTKGVLGESNTRYAQGGLAAAVGADDSPALLEADTLAAGGGLCDPGAVRALVEGAPAAVEWLLDVGANFDREAGELLLGREAAHARRRVLHAEGDATGAEIERALVERVRRDPRVHVFEHAAARDLLLSDGGCAGAVVSMGAEAQAVEVFDAPLVVLAAGGVGQLWATTSNPGGATADGLAMALRAGVAVADLEFVQFHPTVLRVGGTGPFLISEAVRGEGAYLRSINGERFMVDQHPLAELAPRDVVARAIQRQMALDGSEHVWLDLRHLDAAMVAKRFPSIGAELCQRGIDLARDPIPIAPAAHYAMGGVTATPTGETSLPGLLALGEAACTGVHGANRLASNSLLEGLVFGLAAADRIGSEGIPARMTPDVAKPLASAKPGGDSRELAGLRVRLQRVMSQHVALVRDGDGLWTALGAIQKIEADLLVHQSSADTELVNMAIVARHIIGAALHREESRGGHFRADFPETVPALDDCHSLHHGANGDGWRYGELGEALRGRPSLPAPCPGVRST